MIRVLATPLTLRLALFLTLSVFGIQSAGAQGGRSTGFWSRYVQAVSEFDFAAEPRPHIYYMLEIVKDCNAIGKPEFAQTVWQRAEQLLDEQSRIQDRTSFFRAALTFPSLDQARRIAKESDDVHRKQEFLDQVDLERLRRGDKEALKNYPRIPLDFFKAIEQGRAYVVAGKYEQADQFIQSLDIPHRENDPRGVGAIVYRQIADHFQKQNDLDNARKYIDKAMAIGGNLYYTGYAVKIKKRSIYGELDKGLAKFARFGQSYRGHMGRELVQRLLNELVEQDKLKQAKKTTPFLEKQSDRERVLQKIAVREAALGHHQESDQTLAAIEDPVKKIEARLQIAAGLALAGKREEARTRMAGEFQKIKEWSNRNQSLLKSFGEATGAIEDHEMIQTIMGLPVEKQAKAGFLQRVIRGYKQSLEQKTRAKTQNQRDTAKTQ